MYHLFFLKLFSFLSQIWRTDIYTSNLALGKAKAKLLYKTFPKLSLLYVFCIFYISLLLYVLHSAKCISLWASQKTKFIESMGSLTFSVHWVNTCEL